MFSQSAMTTAAGAGALVWVVGPLLVLLFFRRTHDPQRGQAVGCLLIVSATGATLGALRALAAWLDAGWLIRGVGTLLLLPLGLAAVNAAAHPIVRLRARCADRREAGR